MVPNYRLIIGGAMSLSFDNFAYGCQCMGRILGIIDQDPSVSKTNQLHVDIFQVFYAKLKNILKFL